MSIDNAQGFSIGDRVVIGEVKYTPYSYAIGILQKIVPRDYAGGELVGLINLDSPLSGTVWVWLSDLEPPEPVEDEIDIGEYSDY